MSTSDSDVQLDPTLDFLAGTVAGMAGVVVGHPLDTVKVRLQTPKTASRYTGTLNALRTITREESVRGLFKGMSSPLAGTAFLNGVVFASYGFFIRVQLQSKYDEPSISQITLAGAGSGIVASIVTTPIELVKIRQQMELTKLGKPPSAAKVAWSTFQTHGIRGLYRGVTSTALRDIGYGTYFGTYEAACRLLRAKALPPQQAVTISECPHHRTDHGSLIDEVESPEHALPWPKLMLAGGLAGIAGWLSTFPMDPIKSRIQATNWISPAAVGPTNPYNNTLSAIKETLRELGPKGLFAGLTPTLVRAVPVNMATFLVFELTLGAMTGTTS